MAWFSRASLWRSSAELQLLHEAEEQRRAHMLSLRLQQKDERQAGVAHFYQAMHGAHGLVLEGEKQAPNREDTLDLDLT